MDPEEFIFDEWRDVADYSQLLYGNMSKIWMNSQYGKAYFGPEGGEKPEQKPKVDRMRIIMPNTPAWDHITETVQFCGLDMKGSITISTEEFEQVSAEEWDQIEVWANDIPNLNVDEILKNKLLHVYTVPAVITTLERT